MITSSALHIFYFIRGVDEDGIPICVVYTMFEAYFVIFLLSTIVNVTVCMRYDGFYLEQCLPININRAF